jgi:hypothetical protein
LVVCLQCDVRSKRNFDVSIESFDYSSAHARETPMRESSHPAAGLPAAIELGPGRARAVQRAVVAVGQGLARAHGQRQFYALAQVQAQAVAAEVAPALQAWVHATFVARADFEAYFAMRETPGTYEQLRAAMSVPEVRVQSYEPFFDDPVDTLWQWLDLLAEP